MGEVWVGCNHFLPVWKFGEIFIKLQLSGKLRLILQNFPHRK